MRVSILIIIAQCWCNLLLPAVTLPFERDGEPFYLSKFEIVWVATNQLPRTVRIYKVVPASFSPSAIGYLRGIGGSVDPKRGALNFYKPTDASQPLENVPDKSRAYDLGTNVLQNLGVPPSELETEAGRPTAWFSPGTRGHFDKVTRKQVVEPCTMGITFRRTLDGLRCNGQEVHLRYEAQESLTQLEVRWHGLQATEDCAVASPEGHWDRC